MESPNKVNIVKAGDVMVLVTIIIGEPRALPAPSFSRLTRTTTHSAVEIFQLPSD